MKKTKKVLFIVLSILLIVILAFLIMNWTTIKTVLILRKGSVEQKDYNVEIPFEYNVGLIFIDVIIEGNTYKFLLDSGSSNVISTDLAKKLNLQSKSISALEDSQSASSEYNFTTIKKIQIGGLSYLDTGAAILDLNDSDDIACLNIHGLIGANLMKKSIWKIDYQSKTIQLSDNIKSIDISSESEKIPMFTELTGSPIIDVIVNQTEERNVVVDLGSNGGFDLSMDTYNALLNSNPDISQNLSYGLSSSALSSNALSKSNFYNVLSSNLSFGEVELANTRISFSENENVSTIGSQFLENYDVIFNWFDYEIILIKKKEHNLSDLTTYGFSYGYNNNYITIDKLFENSSASAAGLKIDDKIIKVNDTSFDTVSKSDWCDILQGNLFENESAEIELTILRKEKKLIFNLIKSNLFYE